MGSAIKQLGSTLGTQTPRKSSDKGLSLFFNGLKPINMFELKSFISTKSLLFF